MTLSNPGNGNPGDCLNVGNGPQSKDAAGEEALEGGLGSGEPGAGLFFTGAADPCFLCGVPPLRPAEDIGIVGRKLSSGKDNASQLPGPGEAAAANRGP